MKLIKSQTRSRLTDHKIEEFAAILSNKFN